MKFPTAIIVTLVASVWQASADTSSIIQLDTRAELAHSPPVYPAPWMDPEAKGWEEAYQKAKEFVSQMTLLEKVNITTGVG